MEFDAIETPRLRLLMLSPTEIAHVFTELPQAAAMDIFGFDTEAQYAGEKHKSDGGYTTYRTKVIKFLMVDKASGRTIGNCALHNWYPGDSRAEIGYLIHRAQDRRHGFMTEAVARVIRYGFRDLELNRIEAFVNTGNVPSLRLLEKNHFEREGLLKQRYCIDGVLSDAFGFALMRADYNRYNGNE